MGINLIKGESESDGRQKCQEPLTPRRNGRHRSISGREVASVLHRHVDKPQCKHRQRHRVPGNLGLAEERSHEERDGDHRQTIEQKEQEENGNVAVDEDGLNPADERDDSSFSRYYHHVDKNPR